MSSGLKLGIAAMLMFVGWGIAQHDRANAGFLIPEGTAVGTQTDQFQLNAKYISATGAQPFAAAPFSLEFTLPSEVQFSDVGLRRKVPVLKDASVTTPPEPPTLV